ncbi:hypothetical protein [Bradyrhizobium sp. USDA 10063]
MKALISLIVLAFVVMVIASSETPSYAASFGAMSGKGDFGTKGYKQAAKEKAAKGTKAQKQH